MHIDLLEYLACPEDKNKLEFYPHKWSDNNVLEGIFFCQECRRWFPLENSIPQFYRDEHRRISESRLLSKMKDQIPKFVYEDSRPFNYAEATFTRDTVSEIDEELKRRIKHNIDVYDKNLSSQYLHQVEISSYMELLEPKFEDVILEIGCGTGRVTLELNTKMPHKIIALDFALDKLMVFNEKIGGGVDNIYLIGGDVSYLPFKERSFDKIVAFQVFEHILPEYRIKGYFEISRVLKDKGLFLISVYNWSLAKRFFSEKENYPSGEIHYWYNFTPEELAGELKKFFFLEELLGIRCIPARTIADRFSVISEQLARIDKLITKTWLGKVIGHLLLAKCCDRKYHNGN